MNDTQKPDRDDRDKEPRRRSNDGTPRRNKPRHDGHKPRHSGDRSERKPRQDGGAHRRTDRHDGKSPDRKPRRDGERYDRKPRRDGERYDRKPRRDGERFEGQQRGKVRPQRDGDRYDRSDRRPRREEHGRDRERSFAPRDRKYRGGTGRERSFAEVDGHDFRPVRAEHVDPHLPEHLTPKDLHPSARNELKTLEKDLGDIVALHLAAVAHFIDEQPEIAHQHAISAMRKASRIPVTRETYAITSYLTGDYNTALRELRTYRRLTGREDHIALMIDAERAMGRPEKAIEVGREADLSDATASVRVQAAIAMSGARLDLGQTRQALYELEIPELDPKRAYSWSPELFAAYANVLEDLGRVPESREWRSRAFAAEEALHNHYSGGAMQIFEIEEEQQTEDADSKKEGDQ